MKTATLEYPPCDYLHALPQEDHHAKPQLVSALQSAGQPVGYAGSLSCHLSSTAQLSLFRSWLGEQPWAWRIQELTPLISDVNVSGVLWPESLHFHRCGCHLFPEFPSRLTSHDTSKLWKLQSWASACPGLVVEPWLELRRNYSCQAEIVLYVYYSVLEKEGPVVPWSLSMCGVP